MVDQGPGPLGLCPVRGIVEVVQDSNIWLANTGSQPIQIDKDEVVALAECVLAQPAIKQRVRRYPAARREEERQLVEDMLAIGIIQESNSTRSSPTVQVKKKDGTTRFCIDYRRLNQATKVDTYPLPHIEDSLNTLDGARFFCSLDLASGYWQVEMDVADREKAAFVTQGGLYEFRVMPFGLVNAPATFERLMERVLRGIAWSECLVYLIGNGLYLLGRIGGNGVSFLVDTGSGVSILAARTWRKWGRTEDELTRYWGRLCSVEGRALECLGKARLTVTLGTRVVEWGFIVAEFGDDEGILGNDFAMAHELPVRPCEGAVYLPDHAGTGRGHMGERLPCTIRVVTEVRAVTEETLVVRAVGPATLAPHTVSQVRVIVPTPRAWGTVMVDQVPGPLGLCPVRRIVEVVQDSNIWLANTGSQPIQIDKDEVVALVAEPGASAGSDRDVGDEVNG